jgi:hypothetical protein
MEKNRRSADITTRKFPLLIASITTFLLLVTIMPMKGHAALCVKEDKSATYINGYDAAQSDFRDGRSQNQNVTSADSQYSADYKQGYKDGWNDAQYHVNVIHNSIC